MCTGLLVTAILSIVGGIRGWQVGSASLKWPATQAIITSQQMVKAFYQEEQFGIPFATYMRQVSVRYTVNGKVFTSDFRLPSDGSTAPSQNQSRTLIASAPIGEHLLLFYNPGNPNEATLRPGVRRAAIYSVVFGGTAVVVLSMFIFALACWLSKAGIKGRSK